MNEIWTMIASMLVGVLLGALFFGGLWWTVYRGLSSSTQPAILFAGSMIVRTAIAVMGFYWIVTRWGWHEVLTCLVGFVLGRLFVTRATRVPTLAGAPAPEGGGN